VGLLDRGVLKVPEAVDVATFVKHDGHPPVAEESQKVSQKTHLREDSVFHASRSVPLTNSCFVL